MYGRRSVSPSSFRPHDNRRSARTTCCGYNGASFVQLRVGLSRWPTRYSGGAGRVRDISSGAPATAATEGDVRHRSRGYLAGSRSMTPEHEGQFNGPPRRSPLMRFRACAGLYVFGRGLRIDPPNAEPINDTQGLRAHSKCRWHAADRKSALHPEVRRTCAHSRLFRRMRTSRPHPVATRRPGGRTDPN